MKTKGRTIDEMLAVMKKPKKQKEEIVIYFHQEW